MLTPHLFTDDSSPLESSIEEEPGAFSVLETSMESNHSCDESNLKMPVSEDAKSTYSSNDVEGLVDVPEDSVNDDSGSSASSAKRVKSYLVFAILIFIVVLAYTNICMGLIYWKQCNMDTTALILTGICGLVGVFPRVITTIFSRFFKRRYKFTVLTCAAYSLGGPMVALDCIESEDMKVYIH
ncbi:hypothetical protein NPIL_444071 [Nephila pilipes]|uniref:Uncharacterized protein n=1 Tax=Nephila pilipes TaxID=299642 RepID=A0A8X6QPR9_NEPPI|nr:hypothetical protein NPIL_527921 [Nephila pilipes]GFU37758.1 hypothetical protein NPIL_444071 [Nephila pilipes]